MPERMPFYKRAALAANQGQSNKENPPSTPPSRKRPRNFFVDPEGGENEYTSRLYDNISFSEEYTSFGSLSPTTSLRPKLRRPPMPRKRARKDVPLESEHCSSPSESSDQPTPPDTPMALPELQFWLNEGPQVALDKENNPAHPLLAAPSTKSGPARGRFCHRRKNH